eukprot:365927-Chlamydomonas_euryale.AAC.4
MQFRTLYVPRVNHFRRVVEVVLLCLFTVTLFNCITWAAPCLDTPVAENPYLNPITMIESTWEPSDNSQYLVDPEAFQQLWCPPGKYNAYSPLFHKREGHNGAIRQLWCPSRQFNADFPPFHKLIFSAGGHFGDEKARGAPGTVMPAGNA